MIRCRVAANPEAKTPGLIPQPGTHWQGLRAGSRIAPVMCPEHEDQKAGACPSCTHHASPDPAARAAEVRQAIKEAKK